MSILTYLAIFLGSYLCGSLPWGLWIGFIYGKDVRKEGSGNIGATNVTRVVGAKAGKVCFALDALKGLIPVLTVSALIKFEVIEPLAFALALATVSPVIGHMFSIFLKFSGGKGVSTAAGGILGLAPLSCLAGLIVWVVVFKTSRYVSLASIIAAFIVPIVATILSICQIHYLEVPSLVLLYVLCALAIVRHHSNIKRLLNGTENRFAKK